MILVKKLSPIILICFMVSKVAMLLGMELEKLNNGSNDEVLYGLLFNFRNYIRYMYLKPSEKIDLERILGISLKENEPVVRVWAHSKDKSNWSEGCYWTFSEMHPKKEKQDIKYTRRENTFPSHLPLFLIDDKKEGDTIDLKVCGLPVRLKCDQLHSRYGIDCFGNPNLFHEVLARLKAWFVKYPSFACVDEEIYVKKGILVKEGGAYKHGPKGFHNAHEENNDAN